MLIMAKFNHQFRKWKIFVVTITASPSLKPNGEPLPEAAK